MWNSRYRSWRCGPNRFAGFGVEAVDFAVRIGNEHQTVGHRRGRHAAVDILIRPDFGAFGDVADLGGVDAIEDAFAAAVPGILAHRHVNAVIIKHGRADDFAGTDVSAVVVVAAILQFAARPIVDGFAVFVAVLRRIAIERPDFVQESGLGRGGVQGFEGVTNAVAGAEKDQGLIAHLAQRRRRPLPVEHPRADHLVVFGRQPAGPFVQRDQAGRHGKGGLFVVHAVAGVHVYQIAVNQDRATGGVVREYRKVPRACRSAR